MKRLCVIFMGLWIIGGMMVIPSVMAADFSSGSTGADGAFEPTEDTELVLPEDGIFNFTTVNIPEGVTVTFRRNRNNTPVTILASGDVTVAGTISVNGEDGNVQVPGRGGPGGYSGGYGGIAGGPGGNGEGPGGGGAGRYAGGGGFGTEGGQGVKNGNVLNNGGKVYGNERLLPIIGGSGGGGGSENLTANGGGGGGGGSLLIASSGTINIIGAITANGGNGVGGNNYYGNSGGGSGGSIRLLAHTISGNGMITARGGAGAYGYGDNKAGDGGIGRIRLEAETILHTVAIDPPQAVTVGYAPVLTLPDMPTLAITRIAGQDVPISPTGMYAAPDLILPVRTTNPVSVEISATNIPVGVEVTLTVSPQVGSPTTVTGLLSGTDASSTAIVEIDLSTTYSTILTASTTFSIPTASNGGRDIYAEGEKVVKMKVASVMGGGSRVSYITESGREIPVL